MENRLGVKWCETMTLRPTLRARFFCTRQRFLRDRDEYTSIFKYEGKLQSRVGADTQTFFIFREKLY